MLLPASRSLKHRASLAAIGSVVVVAAVLGVSSARAQAAVPAASEAVTTTAEAEQLHCHDAGAAAPVTAVAPSVAAAGAGAEVAVATEDGSSNPFSDRFPNVELTTHEGKRVRFYDDLLKGKIVMINFMYATCKGR